MQAIDYPPLELTLRTMTVWWRDWLNLTVLNLVWVLCCLLIIPGPPATFAVYAHLQRKTQGEDWGVRDLLRATGSHFRRSWLWLLPNLFIGVGLFVNLRFYRLFPSPVARGFELFSLLLAALWFFLQFYTLPYLFVQERPSLRQAYRNALLTTLASPLYSLSLAGVVSLLLYAGVQLAALFFLVVPILIALLGTHAVQERLKHFRLTGSP